jgi:hypothetical protein
MVNENDIRTRAYFHFENRTGKRWQDPDANWSQAEEEERAWATARASDISGELFTYRPLSQMIPIAPSQRDGAGSATLDSSVGASRGYESDKCVGVRSLHSDGQARGGT